MEMIAFPTKRRHMLVKKSWEKLLNMQTRHYQPTSSHSSSCRRFFSPTSFLSLLLCMVYQYRKSHYIMYNFDRKSKIFLSASFYLGSKRGSWVQFRTFIFIFMKIFSFAIWSSEGFFRFVCVLITTYLVCVNHLFWSFPFFFNSTYI